MTYLCKLGNSWEWSEIYFNANSNEFIRKKYHEEYLDTGTVYEGSFPISDVELWKLLVEEVNADGINQFLKIRNFAPDFEIPKGISLEVFQEKLFGLKSEKPYFRYSFFTVGEVSILRDEHGTIICVLSKTDHFWFVIHQFSAEKKEQGFHSMEEGLEYILEKITRYHKNRVNHANLENNEARPKEKKSNGLLSKLGRVKELCKFR